MYYLDVATDISYILSQKLIFRTITSFPGSVIDLLQRIEHLYEEIDIGARDMEIVHQYYVANESCMFDRRSNFEGSIEVLLNIQLFAEGTIHRQSINNTISKALKPLQIEDLVVEVVSDRSYESFHLPSLISSFPKTYCRYFKRKNKNFVNFNFPIDKFLNCPQLSLDDADYQYLHEGTSLEVKALYRVFEFSDFKTGPDGYPRICVQDFYPMVKEPTLLALLLSLITYVCAFTSLVCLLLTILVYCAIEKLRTLAGKNIAVLCTALLLAQSSVLVGSQELPKRACPIMGSFIHYFWLTVFCSNLNCSFHMYRVFSSYSVTRPNPRQDKKIFMHSLLAIFILPLIIVGCYIIYSIYMEGQVPYNGKGCFINDILSFIYFFLIPIVLVCFTNISLFLLTFREIKNVPKTQSNIERRRLSVIYLKLLIITGTTWLLQLIDGLFPMSLFSILVILLNGSQGLFIFVSYICTKKCSRNDKASCVIQDGNS